MNFRNVCLAFMLTATVFMPAKANTIPENDVLLIRKMQSNGVTVKVNAEECFNTDKRYAGWYAGHKAELVVCAGATWDAEDSDTLRHEAHHYVQDCVMKENFDGWLSPLYEEPVRLAVDYLDTNTINGILNTYGKEQQLLELEAWAVARMANYKEQLDDIQNYCAS